MFPELEFIGWYSTTINSKEPADADKAIHRSLQEYNENALYLLMDMESAEEEKKGEKEGSKKDMPVYVYEAVF